MAYTQEQRRMHILELQKYLFAISLKNDRIPPVIPDGIYGKTTALAVRAFQSAYGLKVTGETDRTTWDKIVSVYRESAEKKEARLVIFPDSGYIYSKGDSGLGVSVIQAVLHNLGKKYNNLKPARMSGIFDADTEKAVAHFQKQTNLPSDGKVDLKTWNIMAADN